jgi:two-component system response regulator AtoC
MALRDKAYRDEGEASSSESAGESRLILICDQNAELRRRLDVSAKSAGYTVLTVACHNDMISVLQDGDFNISAILFGSAAANPDAIDKLRQIRELSPLIPVVIVAGVWTTHDIINWLRNGATDFVFESVVHEELTSVLKNRIERSVAPPKPARRRILQHASFRSTNQRVVEIEASVEQIGYSGAPVLIQGETGSGKEVLARSLHEHSLRSGKPFLKFNCAALPSELVESELFGYERGAFTGAFEKKAGIFELADGGTILLDEIGDMDIRLQAKLLQVLQDHEFRRIGGKEIIKVNVRVIAATHRNLEQAIVEQAFREDLYYRLNVVAFELPPLRERTDDIIALAQFLLRKHAAGDQRVPALSPEMCQAMLAYSWPGNVRELENCMRKFLIFRDPDIMTRDLLGKAARKSAGYFRSEGHVFPIERRLAPEVPVLAQVTKARQQAEVEAILAALEATRWNRKQAASILKTAYKSLLYKMKKLGIDDMAPVRHRMTTLDVAQKAG